MKDKFDQWFNNKNFRHFSPAEFTSYFGVVRRGVANSYPPEQLWENIVPTLRVVDNLRDELDVPIVILSSYRSPQYNAAIDGAAVKSYHMQFRALDIAAAGFTPRQVYSALLHRRSRGEFRGGLGLYSTFVHVDTRGYNADWGI